MFCHILFGLIITYNKHVAIVQLRGVFFGEWVDGLVVGGGRCWKENVRT